MARTSTPMPSSLRRNVHAVALASSAWALAACSTLSLDELQASAGTGAGGGVSSASTGGAGPASSTTVGSGGAASTVGVGGAGGATPCPEGQADCDGDGVCAPLSDDPSHCGACGHDCLGGDCQGARCQPVVLWEGTIEGGHVTGIDIDAEHVFFCSSGAVRRVPKTGGEPLVLHDEATCTRIEVDGPHAYYSWGGISRVPLAGGLPESLTAIQDVNGRGIAVDATHAWAVAQSYLDPFPYYLLRAARDGSAQEAIDLGRDVWGVTVDDSWVYVGGLGGLYRLDKVTLDVDDSFASPNDGGSALVLHDGRLFYLGAGLWSVDVATGEETLLRPELSNGQVSTDGTSLLVTLFDEGTLWRVSFDGSEKELLADVGPGLDVVVEDESAIYLSHFEEQQLLKLAK